MSFEQAIRIPKERLGVLIGKSGETKKSLEEEFGVKIDVDSRSGDIIIKNAKSLSESDPSKARQIVEAIGRGFSPKRALKLRQPEIYLQVIDLREYAGKSRNSLERIKGRLIGMQGKARRVIEELTGAYISVYGHSAAVIGSKDQLRLADLSLRQLASGSEHKVVYAELQRERTKAKMERLKLWEDQTEQYSGSLHGSVNSSLTN
ncbi:MAG: KH domain-containing protein [Conexivisphaerales archaeon]